MTPYTDHAPDHPAADHAPAGSTRATGAHLAVVLGRRSIVSLTEPGPTPAQLDLLLRAAATVPDHGGLRPWRFVVVSGAGRSTFGEALARSAAERTPGAGESVLERVRQKAFMAPTQVLVVASPRTQAKVAEWEQLASAACTGYAVSLAAHALGLGTIWKSVPFTRGAGLSELLGLAPEEQLLGWINVGTPAGTPPDRPPIEPVTYTSVLTGAAPGPYVSPAGERDAG